MDMTPTDEHKALRDVVAQVIAESTRGGSRADPSLWGRLAEIGLLGLSVPERLGGAGGGLIEETILFEELGAGLTAEPVFSTVALSLPLLAAAPDASGLVPDVVGGTVRYALAMAGPHAPSLLGGDVPGADVKIDGPPDEPALRGERGWVIDAVGADGFLVPVRTTHGPAVYLAPMGPAIRVTAMPTVDSARPAFAVTFANAPARLLLDTARASAALTSLRRTAMLMASAEALGIGRQMLSVTTSYACARSQFGRPIGTYQAVSHQLADTYVDLELARSLVMWAALEPTDTTTQAAASHALPTAVRSCERAIQLHGGIGMTWEAPIHRYYKRALLLRALAPRPALIRGALARSLLDA